MHYVDLGTIYKFLDREVHAEILDFSGTITVGANLEEARRAERAAGGGSGGLLPPGLLHLARLAAERQLAEPPLVFLYDVRE